MSTIEAIICLLDEAGKTSKRTEKVNVLKTSLSWSEEEQLALKATFIYAMAPTVSLGIKDISDIPVVKTNITTTDAVGDLFFLLSQLEDRTLTGQEAKNAIGAFMGSQKASTVDLFKRIVEGELKAGIGAKTFNSVYKDAIYIQPYMRCSLLNQKTASGLKYPCFSQSKLDGMYVDIKVESDKVTYFSREGNILPFNDLTRDNSLITMASGYTLQGEAMVLNEDGTDWIERSQNNGYLNSDDIDINRVLFVCWDIIPNMHHEQHVSNTPYESRLRQLHGTAYRVSQIEGKFLLTAETKECNTIEEVIEHFKEHRAKGMEGTVVKNKDMIWKDGTSKEQLKLKVSAVGDLQIIGWKEGEGKNAGLVGSLLCKSSCGMVEVNVNCKSDAFRKKATENIDKWIESGTIVSVIYNDIVENELKPELKSLYLPRMEGDDIRTDKHEADSLERLQDILDNFEFLM